MTTCQHKTLEYVPGETGCTYICLECRTTAEIFMPEVVIDCTWTPKYNRDVNGEKYYATTCGKRVYWDAANWWSCCPCCGKPIKVTP